jgi:hypothetical protein
MKSPNRNLSYNRKNPIDSITPEQLIEYQRLLDDMAEKHRELTNLLNALEGAVLFREWQKNREKYSTAGQAEPSESTSASL